MELKLSCHILDIDFFGKAFKLSSLNMETILSLAAMTDDELRDLINRSQKNEQYVISIVETMTLIGGQQLSFRRIFYEENNFMNISKIGWVLIQDIDKCMICSVDFINSKTKYHCHACGNIICSSCCQFDACIEGTLTPGIACHQCYWEQAIVSLNPTVSDGLPVYIGDPTKFGRVDFTTAEACLLVRASSKVDLRKICINICSSDKIPQHSYKGLIFMLYGPMHLSVDGVKVYHVVVNSTELKNRMLNFSKDFMMADATDEDGGVVELCTQAVSLVSRASCEKLSSNFKIDQSLPFYNHELTKGENERYGFSLSAAKQQGDEEILDTGLESHQTKKIHLVELAISEKKCFDEFIQVPLSLDQAKRCHERLAATPREDLRRGMLQRAARSVSPTPGSLVRERSLSRGISPRGYPPRSPLRRDNSKIQSETTNDPSFRLPVSGKQGAGRGMGSREFSIARSQVGIASKWERCSSAEEQGRERASSTPVNRREMMANHKTISFATPRRGRPGLLMADGSVSTDRRFSGSSVNLSGVGSPERQGSVKNRLREQLAGQGGITPEMMVYEEEDRVDEFTASQVKLASRDRPDALIGWLIFLIDQGNNRRVLGIVTDTRKNLQRKTEFKVSNVEGSQWFLLNRGTGKTGCSFQVFRNIENA